MLYKDGILVLHEWPPLEEWHGEAKYLPKVPAVASGQPGNLVAVELRSLLHRLVAAIANSRVVNAGSEKKNVDAGAGAGVSSTIVDGKGMGTNEYDDASGYASLEA